MPLGVYLYYFYPAWSWMYFFDPNSLKEIDLAVLGVAMVFSYLLSLILGFQLAQVLVRRQKERALVIIILVGLIGLGFFCLFTKNRLLWVGDYAEWIKWNRGMESGAIFLLKHRLSWVNSIMAVLGFGSLGLLLRKLK